LGPGGNTAQKYYVARDHSNRLEKKVVLIAEDDFNDVAMVERAARKLACRLDLRIVKNGEEAIEWLGGRGLYADSDLFPFPDVLVTDVKMPRRNGIELLACVRKRNTTSWRWSFIAVRIFPRTSTLVKNLA
jgi:CheY-like chemotaxis protein